MIEKPVGNAEQAQLDAVKQRIRQILGELKTLAKSEVGEQGFLTRLIERTLESTGAAGAAIWQVDEEGQVSVLHEAGATANNSRLDADQLSLHERLVRTVVGSGRPTLIEPDARDQGSGQVLNPMAFLLLLKPLNDPALHHQFVLELFQRPDIAAAARTGYMRYLEEIGEIFSAWQARNQLRFQSTRQGQQQRTLNFVRDIHASLDPASVAYAAANDGRVLAGCDRLSVLSFDGRRCKILSISGQDDFDNRSNIVRKQQNLASLVCRTGQPLWLVGQSDALPRATRELVDDYLNESHSRTLGVIPLFDGQRQDLDDDTENGEKEPPEPVGALIVEWFGQDISESAAAPGVEVLSDHIGRALANAQTYRSIFLLPLWKALGNWKWLIRAKTLPKTVAAVVTAVVLLLFFCFFPWPLNMRVEGLLQPVEQQNVFANIDGVISRVLVKHGQVVEKDELLLELRNDEMEYQLTAAIGELDKVKQEIETAEAIAVMASQTQSDQRDVASSRLASLEEQRVTIEKQVGQLLLRKKKLEIRSPIAGTVVSWDPVRQLTERPVAREDVVLVVAAVDSDWQMELYIPERKYGHVLRTGELPEVTFFAATNPNRSYQGQITRIESHASEHPGHGSTVRAFATFDPSNQPEELYVGAAVTAKIHCGHSSVGYAWFHELFEFIQSRIMF